MATNLHKVPTERRPKRMRTRKQQGTVARPEFVVEFDDGTTAVLTYEEILAEAKRRAAGRGLSQ